MSDFVVNWFPVAAYQMVQDVSPSQNRLRSRCVSCSPTAPPQLPDRDGATAPMGSHRQRRLLRELSHSAKPSKSSSCPNLPGADQRLQGPGLFSSLHQILVYYQLHQVWLTEHRNSNMNRRSEIVAVQEILFELVSDKDTKSWFVFYFYFLQTESHEKGSTVGETLNLWRQLCREAPTALQLLQRCLQGHPVFLDRLCAVLRLSRWSGRPRPLWRPDQPACCTRRRPSPSARLWRRHLSASQSPGWRREPEQTDDTTDERHEKFLRCSLHGHHLMSPYLLDTPRLIISLWFNLRITS